MTGRTDANGEALRSLPAAAGTMTNPPAFDCYVEAVNSSGQPAGQWILVASGASTRCGLLPASNGTLVAWIAGAPANWAYAFVVVY